MNLIEVMKDFDVFIKKKYQQKLNIFYIGKEDKTRILDTDALLEYLYQFAHSSVKGG